MCWKLWTAPRCAVAKHENATKALGVVKIWTCRSSNTVLSCGVVQLLHRIALRAVLSCAAMYSTVLSCRVASHLVMYCVVLYLVLC